jgi:acetolactate synthase-1/2/3 large subunit
VDRVDELDEALEWAANTPGTVIVDVAVDQERNVYPMIPSGLSVNAMIEEAE